MATVCPFCRNSMEPGRDAQGRLVCPLCRNTGRAVGNPAGPAGARAPVAFTPSGPGASASAQAAAPPPPQATGAPAWTQPAAPTPPGQSWPAAPVPWNMSPPPKRTNGLAVAAMVVGIAGIFPLYFLGILMGPAAIIMGAIAMKRIKADPSQSGHGMALAGLICGCVAVFIGLIVASAVVFVLVSNLSRASAASGSEEAAATVSSPFTGQVYLTLIRGGDHAPYALSDVTVKVDGSRCPLRVASTGSGLRDQSSGSQADGKWGVGETVVLGSDAGCSSGWTSGSTHLVSVTLHGTIVKDNEQVVLK